MKVLLFANTDWYLYNFRIALAEELQSQGNEVVCISPPGPYVKYLIEKGFHWIKLDLKRSNLNPFKEISTILNLVRFYRRERPDLVNHFTVKCVLYGSMAAYFSNSPTTINSITGLGYAFSENAGGLNKIASLLYSIFVRNTWLTFQNPEDQEFFIQKGWATPSHFRLIRGSGVNVNYFTPQPFPEGSGLPKIILPARMLWSKGVREFVEAGRILKQQGIDARFILVGDTDPGNPEAVAEKQLKDWQNQELVEFWGWQTDMRSVYAQATIVCLPSYREGVPKTLLEAAACGRALVASDVPGCREIVKAGYNGLLVPSRDGKALAQALLDLLQDPARRQQMALNGRKLVVDKFSTMQINKETLDFYSVASR